MGWLDNLLGVNDPSQAASLALGTNLLSTGGPSRMPISTGQAIGNALMGARDTAVGTQNDILKRQLVQAQIMKALNDLRYGNAPANVRTAMWYANDATPAEKNAFASTVRSAEVKSYNGINYIRDLTTGEWRPMLPIEEQVRNLDLGAATTSGATAREKARWDVEPTFSPENNQFMFTSKYDLARAAGAPASPPQVAPRLPNSLSVAPPTSVPPNVPRTNPDAAGLDSDNGYPSTAELDAAMRRFQPGVAPPQQTPVRPPTSMLPAAAGAGVTKEREKAGTELGDMYTKIQGAGYDAQTQLAKLDRFEQLLSGLNTGKLTPLGKDIAGYLASVGVDIDPNLPNKQAADSLSKEMALMLRKPGQQSGGMPGNFSDADRQFLVAIAPGLANTPGGNALIVQTLRKAAQREQEMAKLAYDYKRANGTMDGFAQAAKAFADSHPLYGEESAKAAALLGGQSSTPKGTRSKTRDGRDVEWDGIGWKLVTP